MPTVDVVTVPVKPGINVLDSDTPEAKAFAESMQILDRQDGFRWVWYGHKIEDATKLMLFLIWDCPQSQARFAESSDHETFIESLSIMLAGRPTSYRVQFVLRVESWFMAPVIEIVEARFQEMTAELGNDAEIFFDAVEESEAGFVSWTMGWTYEDVEHEELDGKGKILMLVIGWESVDAHMKARETDAFKNTIRGLKRHIKSMAAFHVALKYHKPHAQLSSFGMASLHRLLLR
ncbi:hypothetical protein MBLNU457_g2819t1 [Dothideomycetes sp. NU457]